MVQSNVLEQARAFIYSNARLLDRKRFEYLFEGGSKEEVLRALKAYQNDDGGFGNALEPDIRCPNSQPVPTEYALYVMSELDCFDADILNGIIRYLKAIAVPGGGFPLAYRSLQQYPHAPWWKIEDDGAASINPTGQIMGYLLKQKTRNDFVEEEWFKRSLNFVKKTMEQGTPAGYHDGIQWITFLEHAPESYRSIDTKRRFDEWLASPGVIERNPHAEGYVHKVLDWVTGPQSYAAQFVTEAEIEEHLSALIAEQEGDGGWPINFPAVSSLGELEWRGSLTVERLKTLRAFGKL
ncbi:hypothetical protein D3P08_09840 [Paenibacillus nanensis]|uniref:Squalene cyclase C-terminal domain-containing protein n=1 Tax=Paenibacillus nanensis TaxID=393251 RepID=A0A3A1V8E6_9BACL|nr:hypothetical protein [Paenibacillus nanensis]RIX53710.1 hypothetical protein D3P08_09840 [Paenibacillus nanensis]